MKFLTKLCFTAATFAVLGTSAAFADDQHLHNRLDQQREQNAQRDLLSPTIAVYEHQRGIGRAEMNVDQRSESRFELRSNAHGQIFGVYVPLN
jgi:hypothetical protein